MSATPAAHGLSWQGFLLVLDVVAVFLCPLLPFFVLIRRIKRGKSLPGLRDKVLGPQTAYTPHQVVVHGVSLGEVGLMSLVVPGIERQWNCRCLLTTSTQTGWDQLHKKWPDHERSWLPLDLPWAVDEFLTTTKPQALVLLELELWPRLIAACHRRNIPIYLLNGRVSERSYRGYRKINRLLRPLLGKFRLALGQNRLWTARLRGLGCRHAQEGGSLKADLVQIAGDKAVQSLRTELNLDERPIFLIASTSEGEEGCCLDAYQEACPDWQIIVAPRHPERGPALAREALQRNFTVWRWSDPNRDEVCPQGNDLRLVDTIGKLSALYALADIAIVGGSLGSGRHGQNMLEAAAHRCATIVGPDTSNFPDAMALLRNARAIVESPPQELTKTIRHLATNPIERKRLGKAGHDAWLAARGASERCEALLCVVPPKQNGSSPC